MARKDYGRDIQVFGQAYVVCRDTEAEAKEYVDYYVHRMGDSEGLEQFERELLPLLREAGNVLAIHERLRLATQGRAWTRYPLPCSFTGFFSTISQPCTLRFRSRGPRKGSANRLGVLENSCLDGFVFSRLHNRRSLGLIALKTSSPRRRGAGVFTVGLTT